MIIAIFAEMGTFAALAAGVLAFGLTRGAVCRYGYDRRCGWPHGTLFPL